MKMTQGERIIEYMREFGSITSWDAYSDLGITQFATRVKELKEQGYEFKTEWESKKNRYGEIVNYKRYYLNDIVSKNIEHIPTLEGMSYER